jgi:diguanylate cyclase (GGDEF)-like protein
MRQLLELRPSSADALKVKLPSIPRLGVLGKVAAALCAVLIALAGLALIALHSTREATTGAERVESGFAERVTTGTALYTLLVNVALAEERLRVTSPAEIRELDLELTANDAKLARQMSAALDDPNGEVAAEAALSGRLGRAYPRYLRVRDRVLRARTGGQPAESLDPALDGASEPLLRDLQRYADAHYREAQGELADLRSGGRARKLLLAAALGFGLLSLLAILAVARGIVGRVREYAGFAGDVAEGDLAARLEPRGRDELARLGRSLNAMVEQLLASSRQRQDSRDEEAAYRAAQDAFSEILQVTETEPEVHEILKLHIERGAPGSHAVVLNKNNSKDRLEATTALPQGSPLAEPLQSAEPRSCLAVRLARTYDSGGEIPSLLECEVCGVSAEQSTCVPLLVSGEVIGSVLVDHEKPFEVRDRRHVNESVAQAAPVLANLRNLALAEARAATDSLTGLPNRRAIQDTLKRMIAHSARSRSPMAAIMLDLDHFKQINDTFGHEEGDAVLASVGDVLSSTVRTSDFVGRSGGEEFVALLPDTDAEGALELAEKLRAAIAGVKLTRVDRAINASFGVAVHPDVAGDAETLMRLADRALYAAKGGGRNRVELAAATAPRAGAGLGLADAPQLL